MIRIPLSLLGRYSLVTFLAVSCTQANAQNATLPQKRAAPADQPGRSRYVPVDSSSAIRLNYGFAKWNTQSTKIDSASILMREGATGRMLQISLEETAPDSSLFSGLYSINWQNLEKLQIEFYIPPQELIGTADGTKKAAEMIAKSELRRKPFILRRLPNNQQSIEIFDTREQAQAALKAYRAEQQLAGLNTVQTASPAQNVPSRKIPSDDEVETARRAQELKDQAAAAAAAADRVRLEQLEARRIADLLAKEAAANAAEKARNKAEAQKLADEALTFYTESKFAEAADRFGKASELDPSNKAYYFQYGVSLYRIEQFNRSVVLLGLAEGPQVNQAEKDYFIGLNYMRMKDYKNSVTHFDKVIDTKNADLSSSAQFYKGLILYEQKEWEPAKASFQAVLDNSSTDPQLDKRAEQYIEYILRYQQIELERSRKWMLSATIGEMYDSNILLLSDSTLSQGNATDTAGWRTLLLGSAKYRPIYEENHEFAIQVDAITLYTLDSKFKSDDELNNTDPTVATLSLPWMYKGLLFGKGYRLGITPGYESIWMSLENNKNEVGISSVFLNISNMVVVNNKLYSTLNLEIRSDDSKFESSTGVDDSSALKVKLLNSNLHFLNEDNSKVLTSEVGITLNQAKGRNAQYDRFDLAIGYIQPFYWKTSATVKAGYYLLNYPTLVDGSRTDHSITLTAGASRPINDIFSTGFVASYNKNLSNEDSNEYAKWTALLTLSAQVGF